jgi:type II secretory pathway component PulC
VPEVPLTPEEKLLRIIESPKDAVHSLRPQRRLQAPDVKLLLKDLKAKYGDKLKSLLTLKSANTILIGAGGLTTLFLVIDFCVGMPRLQMIMRLEDVAKKTDVGNLVIEKLDPLAIYMQEITQRNVFALPEAPPPLVVKKEEAKSELTNIVADFKVVGIIWSEAPQAILEESKTGKTYLVNRGGKLKEARVKDILKDRVVLSYDNQEIEIR